MSVYFVQAGKGGLLKIGFAQNVKKRIADIQTHNHEKVRLVSSVPGSRALEAELHQRFYEYRVRGEWFRLEGKLAEYVATLPVPRKARSERQISEEEALRRSWIGRAWFDLTIASDAAAARSLRMDARMLRRGLGPSGRNPTQACARLPGR